MRIALFILFFICALSVRVYAQPKVYPVSWGAADEQNNARTEATAAAYTDVLQLPFLHDFSTRYVLTKKIDSSSVSSPAIVVHTLRNHGLKTGDTIVVSGSGNSDSLAINGIRIANVVSKYQFSIYKDDAFTQPLTSTLQIKYLRISKLRAEERRIPDTLAFYYNQGGVLISPGYSKRQLNYYTATFDGLNELGVPYSTDPSLVGYTDSLTSQQIDLSTYVPADSIYMSFFYQNAGFGEPADTNDRLDLEFFNNTNNWQRVWSKNGFSTNRDSFLVAMVAISNPIYLHDKFRFRFRSFGRKSGSYDIWNLDFILIDKNRTLTSPRIRDFAIRNGDASILSKYTAMPFRHFFANTSLHLKSNLNFVGTSQLPYGKIKYYYAKVLRNGVTPVLPPTGFSSPSASNPFWTQNITIPVTGKYNFNPADTLACYMEQTYYLSDSDPAPDIKDGLIPYDMMFNNSLSKRTYLYDYYAYDDGEAEGAMGINIAGSNLGIQYTAELADTLTHIDICFARSKGPSKEGSGIYARVWTDSTNGFQELRSQLVAIHYQDWPNGFTRYKFNNPLVLAQGQKYIIGYYQPFNDLLTVGFDLNRNSRVLMYYNAGNTGWQNMSNDTSQVDAGTMMIRPVFLRQGDVIPVSVRPSGERLNNSLDLFPNPTNGSLTIVSKEDPRDLNYTIYSLYGQVLQEGRITPEDNTIDVSGLSSGMYLIRCTDNLKRSSISRFIKE